MGKPWENGDFIGKPIGKCRKTIGKLGMPWGLTLVGGLEPWNVIFSISWEESSQPTNSYFSEGLKFPLNIFYFPL